MLTNTTYVGQARANRRMGVEPRADRRRKAPVAGQSKKTSTTRRPASEWINIPCPAIIERALFDRVRDRL
jgi:hypothetical protein